MRCSDCRFFTFRSFLVHHSICLPATVALAILFLNSANCLDFSDTESGFPCGKQDIKRTDEQEINHASLIRAQKQAVKAQSDCEEYCVMLLRSLCSSILSV